MHLTERRTIKVYDLWSRLYDRTFGQVVQKRQQHALAQLPLRPGDRVLDLGVGVLAVAPAKHEALRLDHCLLVQADAMAPPFAAKSFAHVLISHTIGVVRDPIRVLRWVATLVRPEGRVVILNHFKSPRPLVGAVENVLNQVCMRFGWRSNLSLERLLRGPDLDLEYCSQIRFPDLWKIVVLRRPPARHNAELSSPSTFFEGEPMPVMRETSAA